MVKFHGSMTFKRCFLVLFQAIRLIGVATTELRVLSYDVIDRLWPFFAEVNNDIFVHAQKLLVKFNTLILLSCFTSIEDKRLRNKNITFAPRSFL